MTRICVTALVGGVTLFFYGCAGPSQAQKMVAPAHSEGGPAVENTAPGPKTKSAEPCLVQYGFAVRGFRAIRDDYDRVSVVGEIANVGITVKGVELQATLRDADGRLMAVGHFYPASYTNMVPGETWPFTYSFGRQPDAVRAELRIVGTFRAMNLLDTVPLTQ